MTARRLPVPGTTSNLGLLLDVSVVVTARLGERTLNLRELVDLGVGSTFELDRALSQPVELFVNGPPFARGRVVESGDNWAVELTELVAASAD